MNRGEMTIFAPECKCYLPSCSSAGLKASEKSLLPVMLDADASQSHVQHMDSLQKSAGNTENIIAACTSIRSRRDDRSLFGQRESDPAVLISRESFPQGVTGGLSAGRMLFPSTGMANFFRLMPKKFWNPVLPG
jgi:hypothetical protein